MKLMGGYWLRKIYREIIIDNFIDVVTEISFPKTEKTSITILELKNMPVL